MLLAAALGVVVAAALWWAYFDDLVPVAEHRLEAAPPGRERNLLARDSYSYLHLPMVAGIVLLALGVKKTLEHVDEPLHGMPAFALAGGVAVYLLGQAAYRLRNGQGRRPGAPGGRRGLPGARARRRADRRARGAGRGRGGHHRADRGRALGEPLRAERLLRRAPTAGSRRICHQPTSRQPPALKPIAR